MPRPLRIASWNIRHGGGAGERSERVVATFIGFDADILIAAEFRAGPTGARMVEALVASGYHVTYPPSAPGKNSVMIASRAPITAAAPLDGLFPEQHHLWRVKTGALSIVGVYMPVGAIKVPYWEAVIRAAADDDAPDLFIGDFNTGTNDLDKDPGGLPFVGPEFMDQMAAIGFIDLWRARYPCLREYTWFSPQGCNGFRLDHAFATVAMDRRLLACRYDHAPGCPALPTIPRSSSRSSLVGPISVAAPSAALCRSVWGGNIPTRELRHDDHYRSCHTVFRGLRSRERLGGLSSVLHTGATFTAQSEPLTDTSVANDFTT